MVNPLVPSRVCHESDLMFGQFLAQIDAFQQLAVKNEVSAQLSCR